MENNERTNDTGINLDKNAQINLIVSNPEDEHTVDLGRVFHNMKLTKRLWAWVLVLCLVVGICAPLLLYQFGEHFLTVSSVVTLRYEVEEVGIDPVTFEETRSRVPVTDLTAPGEIIGQETVEDQNGMKTVRDREPEELDLNRITDASILQQALSGMTLSQPVSVSNLQRNLSVRKILTEESSRAQELASAMVENNTADAYKQLQDLELKYQNRFVVSLTNGFGDQDSRTKLELNDAELRQLLDRILEAYNGYLVRTYADRSLPVDELTVIDPETLDYSETVEQLRTALDHLSETCTALPEETLSLRSAVTGLSLNDLLSSVKAIRETRIDPLYSYLQANVIVKDREAMLTAARFRLREAKGLLDARNERIAATKAALASYQNDTVYVSVQESDASKSAKVTTDTYNQMILQQAEDTREAAALQQTVAELEERIARLEQADPAPVPETVDQDVNGALEACKGIYTMITAQLEEIHSSALCTNYADHTAALGKQESFLQANLKKILIGAVVGVVIACGLWFVSALAREMNRTRKNEEEKEAERV